MEHITPFTLLQCLPFPLLVQSQPLPLRHALLPSVCASGTTAVWLLRPPGAHLDTTINHAAIATPQPPPHMIYMYYFTTMTFQLHVTLLLQRCTHHSSLAWSACLELPQVYEPLKFGPASGVSLSSVAAPGQQTTCCNPFNKRASDNVEKLEKDKVKTSWLWISATKFTVPVLQFIVHVRLHQPATAKY